MKTKLKLAIVGLLVSSQIVSCSKYLELEPKSSFGPETIFGNLENARNAVYGAYQMLAGDHGYGNRINVFFPYDTDLMIGQRGNGDNGRRDIARYNLTPLNSEIQGPFYRLYGGIERANQCIKYIPQMDGYANGAEPVRSQIRRLHGEALTLRAQFYFDLVKLWGDVPAQWVPSSDVPDLFLPNMDRDSIYDQILADLELAAQLVPWRGELAGIGETINERLTKGSVKALRARIALFRGGYSLRIANRQMERGSNHIHYYQIAANECREIIQSGQHRLSPSYRGLWKDYLNAHALDPFGEVVFDIAMAGGNPGTDSKIGYFSGLRNQVLPLPSFFYSFAPHDTRRDVTIAPYTLNDNGSLTAAEISRMSDGKFRLDWITNPSFPFNHSVQFMGLNWPLIRYSDVLLMFAEAENEVNNGPTPAAVDAFEQVRKRAFLGNESEIGGTPTTKAGFFEAIVDERGFELSGESIRKYDLIRWNILGERIARSQAALTAMANREPPYDQYPTRMFYYPSTAGNDIDWATSFYEPAPSSSPAGTASVNWVNNRIYSVSDWPYYAEGFTPGKSELMPFPQAAIDANPKLKQNPGY